MNAAKAKENFRFPAEVEEGLRTQEEVIAYLSKERGIIPPHSDELSVESPVPPQSGRTLP
ncbi:MAG: hypothetical protein V1746_07845 [bacterium]